jgi:peptidoglycan/LPS O-acetylase OafA/YrhL
LVYNSKKISQEDMDFISYARGVAILSIVFGHVGGYWYFQPYSSYLHVCGSSFFFFLSGSVLYHSYHRAQSTKSYYIKRLSSLLVPYYLICILSLIVYYSVNKSLPNADIHKILEWLFIHPSKKDMPFPLGQLWFLYTYVYIISFSPIIFYLYNKWRNLFLLILAALVSLATIQYFYNIRDTITIFAFKLYYFPFYNIFFMLGVLLFSKKRDYKNIFTVVLAVIIILMISVVFYAQGDVFQNIDKYVENQNIIYVLLTFAFILIVLFNKYEIVTFVRRYFFLHHSLLFFHKHTFSVYLLHSFSIYIVELILKINGYVIDDAISGLGKFILVLIIVCLMSVPFTYISKLAANSISRTI